MTAYWLMKSEPDVFGIDHLRARPGKRDHWDGVRNYQARNFMQAMRKGDGVLFYHSNCKVPAIVGIAEVVKEAYPDHTAWDPDSKYFDPGSTPDNPRWYMVDIRYRRKLKREIPLTELKAEHALDGFALTRKGNRLSVMPVEPEHWQHILEMEKRKPA